MSRTLKQAIDEADALKPGNPYSTSQKTIWINSLEGRIQTDVLLRDSLEITDYEYDTDQSKALLLPAPYDDIYALYIAAMIDFSQGEYSKYQNSMQMFNECFGNFVRHFVSTYEPAQTGTEYLMLGSIDYTAQSAEPLTLCTLPRAALLLTVVCVVETAFDSGTSDILTLGTAEGADTLMTDGDIDETKTGTYSKAVYLVGGAAGTKISATLTKSGTAAASGTARFYGRVLEARR